VNFLWGMRCLYPVNGRLYGARSPPGGCTDKRGLLPLPGLQLQFLVCPVHPLGPIRTELYCLQNFDTQVSKIIIVCLLLEEMKSGGSASCGNVLFVCLFVCLFVSVAQQPLVGQGLLIIEASRSHSDTPHSVGLLWTGDQPDTETSTWQHTTLTTDRHPCPRRD
jgi:hypothetical protein